MEILSTLATLLCTYRKEAVNGRAGSGIEHRWDYAEKAYSGNDETSLRSSAPYKPQSLGGPFIEKNKSDDWHRSTAVFNITRPYVDAAAAKVHDMLFPTDDRNFEIRPTPRMDAETVLDSLPNLEDEEAAQVIQLLEEEIATTAEQIEKAQEQIDDWLVECEYTMSGRRLIEDSARLGTGVIKGPVPMLIEGRIQPGSKIIDCRNLYPDPTCGENIHDGDYVFEREEISPRKLRDKKKIVGAGWLPDEIEVCLEEGPKSYEGIPLTNETNPRKKYELWYFQGEIPVEVLEAVQLPTPSDAGEFVWANVTLCNDRIIRLSLMPLSGQFVYNTLVWQRRDKHWAGIGVAEQLETPQRGINAALRNLFDNAALSALPQIVFWHGILTPKDGRFELMPGKVWEVADEERPLNDVKNAILFIDIPNHQQELAQVIALMRDAAQETTGMPLIVRGAASSGAVGSDQLQTNAATTILRRLAKNFDDHITRPHLSNYFRWLKEFGPVQVNEAIIHARGSSVLVERDIQAQALIQLVQLSQNPIYNMDPALVAKEWVITQRIDPEKIALSDERRKELAELLNQPDEKAQAQVESSRIRAEADVQQTTLENKSKEQKMALEIADAARERGHDEAMIRLQSGLKVIEYAMQRGIDIKTVQDELEAVSAKLVGSFKPAGDKDKGSSGDSFGGANRSGQSSDGARSD